MANLGEAFDPSTVEDSKFEPLPAGEYLMQVTESEIKATRANTGEMLNLTLEILEGEYRGRRVWERINFRNANASAQAIGRETLKKITEAVMGQGHVLNDSEELHYKPFLGTLKVNPAKGDFDASNSIKKAAPAAGAGTARPNTSPRQTGTTNVSPATTNKAPANGNRPWPGRATA